MTQGDTGHEMFLLRDGVAQAEVGGKLVERYTEGATFGSLALLSDKPRAATVRAVRCPNPRIWITLSSW